MSEEKDNLPEFVTKAWKDARGRMDDWADGAPLFTLAVITDVHTGNNQRYKHLGYLDGIADRYPFDLIGNLGDIGLDFSADPEVETDALREQILAWTREGMSPRHPWIFVKGNHDRMLPRERLSVLNRSFAETNRRIRFGTPLCDYGAVDYPEKKVRFLFLDTADNDERVHFSVTKGQLAFVTEELASCPGGWRLILSSHFSPDPYIGKWRSYPTDGEFAEMR
ncbi:MAG: metallophosphoesterase, partial [Clostridia bacterium]|nr:metallophosphoesterase [Clostridia bacterium]